MRGFTTPRRTEIALDDVVLRPGEHVRFRAMNRAGWGTFGLLVMLGAFPVYLTFERETGRT